jgi:uncharacterized membrane protein
MSKDNAKDASSSGKIYAVVLAISGTVAGARQGPWLFGTSTLGTVVGVMIGIAVGALLATGVWNSAVKKGQVRQAAAGTIIWPVLWAGIMAILDKWPGLAEICVQVIAEALFGGIMVLATRWTAGGAILGTAVMGGRLILGYEPKYPPALSIFIMAALGARLGAGASLLFGKPDRP